MKSDSPHSKIETSKVELPDLVGGLGTKSAGSQGSV